MVAEVYGELNESETDLLTSYCSGQMSDGYVQKSIMQSKSDKVA
jgi:hypothetical protein